MFTIMQQLHRLILISKFPYEWIDFFYLICRNYKFDKWINVSCV